MPRPIRYRKMYQPPMSKGFRPIGMVGRSSREVVLLLEEFEAIKLSDYEGLTHVQAAKQMEISRPTFTRIYSKARKKVAQAFVENRVLLIEGGNVSMTEDWYRCNDCNSVFSSDKQGSEMSCYSCGSTNVALVNTSELRPVQKHRRRDNGARFCICPSCDAKIGHTHGIPCRQMKCPSCGVNLMRDKTVLNNRDMKTAISCTGNSPEANFNAKFGRVTYFALIEGDELTFVKNPAAEADSGAGPMAAEFLAAQGVKKVVSGHFGPKAEQALKAFSIEMVMYSDENKTIAEIKNQFLKN